MSVWFALVAATAAVVWLIATEITRRRAGARALYLAVRSETLLEYTHAAALAPTLHETLMHASDCARAVLGASQVVLVYLAEDRSSCRVLCTGWMNVDLGVEEWSTFVQAPWHRFGCLERDGLRELATTDGNAARLAGLADALGVDAFLPGADRNALVCVLGVGCPDGAAARHELFRQWVASFLPACIQRVSSRYAAQQEILRVEVEQAGAITQALPTEAHEGSAGPLEWAVHENPDDRLGGGFWNAYRLSDDRLFVIAGEIVARDLAATMLSVALRSLCDSCFAMRGDAVEPGPLLSDLNQFIWRDRNPIGLSCLAVLFDPEHRRAHYAVAGRMAMVRLRAVGHHGYTDPLPGDGPLVGDKPDTRYEAYVCDMNPADVFFVLSQAMGAIWRGSQTESAIHLRLSIEDAGTRPLDELRLQLLDAVGDDNRRRGSTPIVVVRERATPR